MLQSLPKDGSWVRFHTELQQVAPDGKILKKFSGTETIGSVGTTTINGEVFRWIEFRSSLKLSATSEQTDVYKLLIPEKRATSGENPLEHVAERWQKKATDGIGRPAYQSRNPNEVMGLRQLVFGPLKDVRNLDPELFDFGDSKLSCVGISGSQTLKLEGDAEEVRKYETRLHKDIPFGVVSQRAEFTRHHGPGEPAGNTTIWTYKLVETGNDAQSEIP
jgi:hypothetical protein